MNRLLFFLLLRLITSGASDGLTPDVIAYHPTKDGFGGKQILEAFKESDTVWLTLGYPTVEEGAVKYANHAGFNNDERWISAPFRMLNDEKAQTLVDAINRKYPASPVSRENVQLAMPNDTECIVDFFVDNGWKTIGFYPRSFLYDEHKFAVQHGANSGSPLRTLFEKRLQTNPQPVFLNCTMSGYISLRGKTHRFQRKYFLPSYNVTN